MTFDELDEKMRVFETAADYCVLPGIFMVARLDGRSFTRLTKDVCQFEAPFDERFRDMMLVTTESLMACGFQVIYGYTESDEISLLFAQDETQFGRKLRKYNSTLAAEASARFSLLIGQVATFDCRISQLPNIELVVDYFRWRNEDAARNALNAYCYWTLRKQGQSEQQATSRLEGVSVGQKNELLCLDAGGRSDGACDRLVPREPRRRLGQLREVVPVGVPERGQAVAPEPQP
jgi:tRNA(His) guanylyltransferase